MSTAKPGDDIIYNSQLLYTPKILFNMRKTQGDIDTINYTYSVAGRELNQSQNREPAGLDLSLDDRLVEVQNEVLVFTTRDLACLHAALTSYRKTVVTLKTRKEGDKTTPAAERVVAFLTEITDAAKATLRRITTVSAPLSGVRLLFQGEPLHIAVRKFQNVLAHRETSEYAPRTVAIYYSFTSNLLQTIDALDVDVPSAAALDAAYALMSNDPNRFILLDLRATFKARRGWSAEKEQ